MLHRIIRAWQLNSRTQAAGLLVAAAACTLATASAAAQSVSYHHPLNQRMPPGQAAAWLQHIRQENSGWLQPVQIDVPGGADVSVFSGSANTTGITSAPALIAVSPGHTYRLRLANMPEFPDVELYPSLEILDRLHPPPGQENRFPIPVPLTRDDIRLALSGRLVTRVIYLEQPQLAQQLDPLRREIPQTVLPSENALQEADRLGRPMIIVRLGSRRPAAGTRSTLFFGTGGAAEVRVSDSSPTGVPKPAESLGRLPQRSRELRGEGRFRLQTNPSRNRLPAVHRPEVPSFTSNR